MGIPNRLCAVCSTPIRSEATKVVKTCRAKSCVRTVQLARKLLHLAQNRVRLQSKIKLSIDAYTLIARLKHTGFRCEKTGLPFGKNLLAPSLDRIKSSGNYSPRNIQIVCLGYQYLKNAFTDSEALTFITQASSQTKKHKPS